MVRVRGSEQHCGKGERRGNLAGYQPSLGAEVGAVLQFAAVKGELGRDMGVPPMLAIVDGFFSKPKVCRRRKSRARAGVISTTLGRRDPWVDACFSEAQPPAIAARAIIPIRCFFMSVSYCDSPCRPSWPASASLSDVLADSLKEFLRMIHFRCSGT